MKVKEQTSLKSIITTYNLSLMSKFFKPQQVGFKASNLLKRHI